MTDPSHFTDPKWAAQIRTDQEREALAAVDRLLAPHHAAAITSMLARPTLPEVAPAAAIAAMAKANDANDWASDEYRWRSIYQAVFNSVTKPETKTVEVWRVEWCAKDMGGRYVPIAAHYPSELAAQAQETLLERIQRAAQPDGPACIKVTGPHQQEVPAT